METPKNNKFNIRKIPLDGFLQLLNDLYAGGADYIDLFVELDDEKKQDNITVSVPIEYMNEDSKNSIEDSQEPQGPPPEAIMEISDDSVLTEKDIIKLLANV